MCRLGSVYPQWAATSEPWTAPQRASGQQIGVPPLLHSQGRYCHQEPSESVPWGTYGEGVAWPQYNQDQPLPSPQINISSR